MNEDEIVVKEGEYLIQEGDDQTDLYWLLEGEVRISKKVGPNLKIELTTLSAGELIGELSFIDGKKRSANVKALTDSKFIKLPYDEFKAMIDEQPKWIKKILETLTERIRKSNEL